ncbi:hypothetical protein CHLRE_03g164700v5 [Chlamydomonas reinhardtii]|uniref:Uncharacterized protein n=1 Tax=Chlamydomonas reinhardtii TaxID=3055 RepID=A0A2K3DWN5_CHLRE|nr:uncharacterized protein CHLRE_03g164700v5 [Chlamydomonas reinhardtii]PNW84933.1 hypothetical protein CHLRE_03g164700v5 [Chlamydomonas reinhardtii]7VCF_O Chain O, Tic35 [Chlamydomonas reinhardtii]
MQLGQLRQPLRACQDQRLTRGVPLARRQLVVVSNWNPLGGKGGGNSKDKEDAARRALEQSLGQKKFGADASKKTPAAKPAEPSKPAGEDASKNPLQNLFGGGGPKPPAGGGGGGGGDGGGGFFSGGNAEQPGGEEPIQDELLKLLRGGWVLLSNLALFLVFSSFLHRSLNWFVQTELLVAVGAPQQAGERVVGKFFEAIEWVERNILGWKLPGDEEAEDATSKVYEVLQNYTPAEAAYSFAQLKYKDLTHKERELFHKAYALRHFERRDGRPGDVDAAELQAVKDRLDPLEADRRAYAAAKAAGRLDEYWAAPGREATYQRIVGAPRIA